MAVTTIFASTADGFVTSSNATYTTARAGSGLVANTTDVTFRVGQFIFGGNFICDEGFVSFDTSAIPNNHMVTVIELALWLTGDSSDTNFSVDVRDRDWGATLTTADWVAGASLGGLPHMATISTNGIGAAGAYKTFVSQSGFLTVTNLKTGTVRLLIHSSRHAAGNQPSVNEFVAWASANDTGTTHDPKLTITHFAPSATGAGGVEIGGSADVTFTRTTPDVQVDSDLVVEWDLDNDGDFSEPAEDITAYVVSAETLTGRDWPSQLQGKAGPGTLKLRLQDETGRFNFFNTGSPLNQGANSLRTGRKIRVRTAEATNPDPVLLARDTFDKLNFSDPSNNTGHIWSQVIGTWSTIDGDTLAAPNTEGGNHLAVIDVGVADYYAQVTVTQPGRDTTGATPNEIGLIYRFQDSTDYSELRINTADAPGVGDITVHDIVAGVDTEIGFVTQLRIYDSMTIGVHVAGGLVTVYLEGVSRGSAVAIQADETEVGIRALWGDGQTQPTLDNFYVWDGLPVEVEGVLWTGLVSEVKPGVSLGPLTFVDVSGVGVLSKATQNDVDLPAHVYGSRAGPLVGATLVKTGLAQPPGPDGSIDQGVVTTGAVLPSQDVNALDALRRWEAFELGFLYETNEGYVAFDQRDARAGVPVSAFFSDGPGGQFGYQSFELKDWSREIVNRVITKAAPEVMSTASADGEIEIVTHQRFLASGSRNDVDPLVSASTQDGDLVIFVIASLSTVNPKWNVPIFWVEGRKFTEEDPSGVAALGLHVYWSHVGPGVANTRPVFYSDVGSGGGTWVAKQIRIPARNWYRSHDQGGPEIGPVQRRTLAGGASNNPPAIQASWQQEPTLYIAVRGAIQFETGATTYTPVYPPGYTRGETVEQDGAFGVPDAIVQVAVNAASTTEEEPGFYDGFEGFAVEESFTIAVRGFNGPSLGRKETVLGPVAVPLTGRFTQTFDDFDSQDDHGGLVRTAPETPDLFAFDAAGTASTDAETYANLVLGTFSDDRPIISITFVATKSAADRDQAVLRRVGHKIRLVANGDTSMGIDGLFFIESINNRWTDAGKRWEVTWELSPA